MAMTQNMNDEPGRLEALLPWYARGSLSAAQMREVETYLAATPGARRMLALIQEELDAAVAANESLGAPSAASRERLMAAIAAEASASQGGGASSLWGKMKAAWASMVPEGISPGYAFGGALAGLVILIQAGALGVMIAGQGAAPEGHKLASGVERGTPTGTFVLVRFAGEAKTADITALLKANDAQIVDGPKPGGVYKLRVADKVLSEPERTAIFAKLRERSDIVSFVSPSG